MRAFRDYRFLSGMLLLIAWMIASGPDHSAAQVIFATATPRDAAPSTSHTGAFTFATHTPAPSAHEGPPPLAEGLTLRGEGNTEFTVQRITRLTAFHGQPAQNGLLVLIEAELHAPAFRCIYGYNFTLTIDGTPYDASVPWMETFKPHLERNFPRRDLAGQCIDGYTRTPTFLVFDVPVTGTLAELAFLSASSTFGWTGETSTPTASPPPTATPVMTATPTPTLTMPPTLTPYPTVTPVPPTARPAATSVPASSPPPVIDSSRQTQTYTVLNQANIRDCPQITCTILATYGMNQAIEVAGTAEGEAVNGSSLWYIVRLPSGRAAYVHSSVVRSGAPVAAQPPPAVVNSVISQPVTTGAQWNCSGDLYNCSDFSDNNLLMSYWNACPGDPSGLDGRGRFKNGIPCDSSWD